MNNRSEQRALKTLHPSAIHLSPDYLQLEGFTDRSATKPAVSTLSQVVDQAEQLPNDTWQDAVISLGVIFALLIMSSFTLGFSAHKITEGLLHMTHQINQQMLKAGDSTL